MTKTQIILLIITILLFIMGMWPIGLLTTGGLIAVAINTHENKRKKEKEELEQLKEKVNRLERNAYIDSLIENSDKKAKEKE